MLVPKANSSSCTMSSRFDDDDAPEDFQCPITQQVMLDPVVDAHGDTYDRVAIQSWYQGHNRSPVSGIILQPHELSILIPNRALKSQIQTWLEKRSQREEMHHRGLHWYGALPAETRRRWDELQHGQACDLQLMMEMQGEDFAGHQDLLFKLLGDLDGDGVLTPDEMRAILYITANFMSCTICQGPILMLDGFTCLDCMQPPFLVGGTNKPWVCRGCVEDGVRGTLTPAHWGPVCPCTQRRHDVAELMEIRDVFKLKLSAGEVEEEVLRRLHPLDAFSLDLEFMLAMTGDARLVLMLRCALGLTLPADYEDENGWTPLHVAALCGHKDSMRFLLLTAQDPESYAHTVMQSMGVLGEERGRQPDAVQASQQYMETVLEEWRQLGY